MVTPLRILFFGTPAFAVPSLERVLASRHPVVGVVTQPDRPRGRGRHVTDAPVKRVAVERQLPLFQPARLRDPGLESALRALQPDLGVVAAYGKLIPDVLLTLPRFGMINVHGSLLPKYRGAAPVHRALMAGETETGVTIMRVSPELDAGAMFARAAHPIGPDDTSVEVERDLARLGADLLVEVVDAIAAGTAREDPQDPSLATHAPKLTREDGLVDWAEPARQIHDKVRALHPWPHAHTFIEGARLILLRSRVGDARDDGAPGTVVDVSHDRMQVLAGDGRTVALEQVQLEGKRPMSARDFLAGHRVAKGTRLGRP